MTAWLVILLLTAIAALLHEAGHLAGALAVGANIRGIGLSWVGLSGRITVWPPCRWRAIAHLLAGPAVNLVAGLACYSGGPEWETAGMVNVLTALFNTVLPQSDGWRAWQVATGGPHA